MRNITNIVVHCTATSQKATVKAIQNYWRNTLKWQRPGYHFLITPEGDVHMLAPVSQITNGVAGHNQSSIHVSYIGGIDAKGKAIDNRTAQQKAALLDILQDLKERFPNARIVGHRDFPGVRKDCPSFDAKSEYASI